MLKKIVSIIVSIIYSVCNLMPVQAGNSGVFIGGYEVSQSEILDFPGVATPATSTTNSARVYYNPNDDKLKLSLNGGAFQDLATGAASHNAVTVTDSDTIDFTLSTQDITGIVKTDSIDDTHIDFGASTNQVDITDIPIKSISGATYTNTEDYVNSFGSAGRKSGGVMTDGGAGNITVTAGTGFIKATDDDSAQLLAFNFPANTSITIPGNSTRYIGVEYNAGTPQIVARNVFNWNLDTEFSLGRVINEYITGADTLHIINNPWWVTDGMTNVIERLRGFGRIRRDENVGGLALSVTGTRNIGVTSGQLWSNLNEFAISTLDTSSAGTFEYYWYKAGTGWQLSEATQYSVTQWNDVTQATLQTIDNNKFCNVWVYVEADDLRVALLYPQAQYNTAAAAQAVTTPSNIPSHISQNGILIGRIIIKQGTAAPIAVQSAFTTTFSASVATSHNNLAGLQGGTTNEYYHMTSAEAVNTTSHIAYSSVWNSNTTAPDRDTIYDYLHLMDTDDNGAIDNINATLWATKQTADSDLTTWAGVTPSANGQSLVSSANYASMRGLLDLEAGTDFYSISAGDTRYLNATNMNAGTLANVRLPGTATFDHIGERTASHTTVFDNSVTLGIVLGTVDAGGATSVEIPNGASTTVDAMGEVGLDSTDDQFIYYGAAKRVIPYSWSKSATIPLLTTADANNISIGAFPYAATITSVACSYCGTTAPATVANFTLTYGNNTAFTHTTPVCTNQTTAPTWQSVTSGALASGQRVFFNITNAATANYTYEIDYKYTVDAQ